MPIPESQLSRWADHGPQAESIQTHQEIREALGAYSWQSGVTYDFYLQGSYRNDTNTSESSDVDVVAELNGMPYGRTLSPHDNWNEFRRDTLKALEHRFGERNVGQGNKSIKLRSARSRLAADVVVCIKHVANSGREGIKLFALHEQRRPVIGYPNLHNDNGSAKGRRTSDRFKRTVRMFKGIRNHLESQGLLEKGVAPSYFVECLLYNAPDSAFQQRLNDTCYSILNWMNSLRFNNLVCQNGVQPMFSDPEDSWSIENARTFITQLIWIWNNWEST